MQTKPIHFFVTLMMIVFSNLLLIQPLQAKKNFATHAEAPFHKGTHTLGVGLGFGVDYDYYGDLTSPPSFVLMYDQGVKDHLGPGNLGIGGVVAVKSSVYKYANGGYKAIWRNYILGVRGTYHLTLLVDKNNKFDPYGGVLAGFRMTTYDDTYYNANPGVLDPYNYNNVYPVVGAFLGAKYNFTKRFGAWAEVGYDISFFRMGLCVNF